MAPVLSSLITLFSRPDIAAGRLGWVGKQVAALRQARANRRAIMDLARWDDHMLADIGLTRTAVHGALEAGFADDPSRIVAADRPQTIVPQVELPSPRRAQPMPAGCWAY